MKRLKNLYYKYKNRIKYGFFDEEVWNLDYTIAKFVLPRLKRFKESNQACYPADINSREEWHEILDKMIWSMESIQHFGGPFNSNDEFNEYYRRQQEGLNLFAEHFRSLWW